MGNKDEITYLREAILATLAYYYVLDYPLTLMEVHKYLVNQNRLFNHIEPVGEITLYAIASKLDHLVEDGAVGQKNGFYFLPRRPAGLTRSDKLYDIRIDREKISAQKWKRLLRIARWFQAVPFLMGVWVSGSMAIDNANNQSDLDVLVITAEKRLYLTRLFLSFVASLFGARRKRYDKTASNKFCFNHYLTENSLTIAHESIYNAETYAALRPIMGTRDLYYSFYRANSWINKYVYNFRPEYDAEIRVVSKIKFLKLLARFGEWILKGKLGGKLEQLAKWYQQRRIRLNPATHQSGGRILYTDQELEFHPRSFERVLIDRYNQMLQKLCGSLVLQEKDSGLT